MKIAILFAFISLFAIPPNLALAHSEAEKSTVLSDACKAECPDAKNDRHAHRCLKEMKRAGKNVVSAACTDALKAHESSEKNHNHTKHN